MRSIGISRGPHPASSHGRKMEESMRLIIGTSSSNRFLYQPLDELSVDGWPLRACHGYSSQDRTRNAVAATGFKHLAPWWLAPRHRETWRSAHASLVHRLERLGYSVTLTLQEKAA